MQMPVVTIEVPALGNRTHLVHDGRSALVVDPPRDPVAVERAAEAAGVDIVAVADTHVHNDYVSGGVTLARRHGADYLLSADEAVEFERLGVRGGDVLGYGGIEVTVLATPGHTRHHQSFVARVAHEPAALLSGGSLLLGTVGRTDLVDRRLALHLAGAQWDSARAQAALDPDTLLLPTHGFGSFCAGGAPATPSGDAPVTVGDQLASHPALTTDRARFTAELVAGFGPYPSYYAHMDPLNRAGAGRPRPARPLSAEQVEAALAAGRWVVDVRDRASYAAHHLPGTVGIEHSHQFATYVGWLAPWGAPLALLGPSRAVLDQVVDDLAAIGVDGVGVHVLGDTASLTGGFRVADWAAYREATTQNPAGRPLVVDVRQRDEWLEGHLPGAVHLPVQDVPGGVRSLPDGELWVHCRSGYRAAIAASLLHRAGREVVLVDDTWDRVRELAIETVPAAA